MSLVAMPQPAGIHAENVVGFGTSGMVALYPNTNTVIKFPHSAEGEDDILGMRPRCQRENKAYDLHTPLICLEQPQVMNLLRM
jgi:hypothetical protein